MQHALNPEHARSRLSRWWHDPSIRIPVLIFIAVRILTLIIGVTAVRLGPVINPYANDPIFLASLDGRQLNGPLNGLIEPWHRWDTGWYLKIAVKGYAPDDGSIIFAPLYPALIAAARVLVGDTLLGALLVTNVCCLIYLIVFYKLALRETNSPAATHHALLALVTFPTAFYLLAGYTESPFLVFTAGVFLAARNKHWWLTAVLAACASLTRLQGWILFFPLGWLAFMESPRFWQSGTWAERIKQAIPRLAAVGAAPLASLGFMLYTPLAGLGSISDAYLVPWAVQVRPPWAAVIDTIGKIAAGRANLIEYAGLIAVVIIVALALVSLRTLPLVYHLYIWPTLFFILLRYYPLYLLNGTMRYVLDFFPLFITAGIILHHHKRWRVVWVAVFGLLQVIMLFLFARWLWVA